MTKPDKLYCSLISSIFRKGETVQSRNGLTRRLFTLPTLTFDCTPLVTVRPTAWSKAIREMEWFLTGDPKCPDELLDWWDGQLNPHGMYLHGYGEQLRAFNHDQIKHLIHTLKTNPFSREHIITTWHPSKMVTIKEVNNNPRTPACCHSTLVQFFVSKDGGVSMHSYQRSADMLLGVPHNWIQSWALLLWVAAQVEGVPDKMLWTFGDAHIYMEPTHLRVVEKLIPAADRALFPPYNPRLLYTGKPGSVFSAGDFEMIGKIPEPLTTFRPTLIS